MTAHLHASHVDGCYRCELNKDEADLGPCHVTGCENPAVDGEIGECGDLLLCADHFGRSERCR